MGSAQRGPFLQPGQQGDGGAGQDAGKEDIEIEVLFRDRGKIQGLFHSRTSTVEESKSTVLER
jgi:hypothetical protein